MLYPVAKVARKNKDNKVRIVRDKHFVNKEEIKIESDTVTETTASRTNLWLKKGTHKIQNKIPGTMRILTDHHFEGNMCFIAGEKREGDMYLDNRM